ncbi:hypothetical protein ACLOJK_016719 [Asimina triloba]
MDLQGYEERGDERGDKNRFQWVSASFMPLSLSKWLVLLLNSGSSLSSSHPVASSASRRLFFLLSDKSSSTRYSVSSSLHLSPYLNPSRSPSLSRSPGRLPLSPCLDPSQSPSLSLSPCRSARARPPLPLHLPGADDSEAHSDSITMRGRRKRHQMLFAKQGPRVKREANRMDEVTSDETDGYHTESGKDDEDEEVDPDDEKHNASIEKKLWKFFTT